jgi:hypothetical protein
MKPNTTHSMSCTAYSICMYFLATTLSLHRRWELQYNKTYRQPSAMCVTLLVKGLEKCMVWTVSIQTISKYSRNLLGSTHKSQNCWCWVAIRLLKLHEHIHSTCSECCWMGQNRVSLHTLGVCVVTEINKPYKYTNNTITMDTLTVLPILKKSHWPFWAHATVHMLC